MRVVLIVIVIVAVSGFYFLKPEASPGSAAVNAPVVIEQENMPEEIPEISVSILPEKVIQGEPVLVTVNGTQVIKSITFENKRLNVFNNEGKLQVLIGIDLRKVGGKYPLVVTLLDGTVIKKDITVGERVIVKEQFHIPDNLGGDTPESEKRLISTLVQEGVIINSIPTTDKKLWEGKFRYPLEAPIVVTDVYGYSRLTGASTIAHKGTDFRALVGTPVYAMNTGTARYTGYLRNYGHTIVLDHGFGLQTIYMHLSEVLVKNGDSVEKGELIGKSGDTGYVFGPHLHLSVKIDHISIDPMKFMELLGNK